MWSHIGEDSIYEIISELSLLAAECVEEMKQNQGMKLDDNDKALGGETSKPCHICKHIIKYEIKR